jgi:hypothetical protein
MDSFRRIRKALSPEGRGWEKMHGKCVNREVKIIPGREENHAMATLPCFLRQQLEQHFGS